MQGEKYKMVSSTSEYGADSFYKGETEMDSEEVVAELNRLASRVEELTLHADCVEQAITCLCHQCTSNYENEYASAHKEFLEPEVKP